VIFSANTFLGNGNSFPNALEELDQAIYQQMRDTSDLESEEFSSETDSSLKSWTY
jgi:hypothetical protein